MKLVWTFACLFGLATTALAQQILVAAAADLNQVMPRIAERFERETGTKVKLSFGSSGNVFAQLKNGAPFDIFFSADMEYPTRLQSAGLGQPGSLHEYAVGKIALWVPDNSPLNVSGGLVVLNSPHVRKIAIANPNHAPYGRAAVAALQHERLYEKVKDKLVLGENISQTFELVNSGNADIGIVALSLVMAPKMKGIGHYALVSAGDYSPIRQGAIILKSSQNKAAAERFLTFFLRPEIRDLMKQYGFEAP
ncbi:MAG TPA: molybdate ABC transporter substrate-binding protein [Terriglobales bacterium]|nr:molybdate ABC transporter substrate-binding protein [Terriglobales bacterium]